jgi:hypothetical protein
MSRGRSYLNVRSKSSEQDRELKGALLEFPEPHAREIEVLEIFESAKFADLIELFAAAQLNWRKTVRTEHANADGKPFVYQANKTDSKL